jgi:hypothetical protein
MLARPEVIHEKQSANLTSALRICQAAHTIIKKNNRLSQARSHYLYLRTSITTPKRKQAILARAHKLPLSRKCEVTTTTS